MAKITITKKVKDAISYMTLNPHHAERSPSDLIRKNKAYTGLTSDEVNFCKEKVFNKRNPQTSKNEVLTEPKVQSIDTHGEKSTFVIESPNPLQPDEIAKLVGADGISVRVDRTWLKSHRDSTWTYSILTVSSIKDFYSVEELTAKLKSILPQSKPVNLPKFKSTRSKKNLLTLNLADIHAGSLGSELTPFPTLYTKDTLKSRLDTFITEVNNYTDGNIYDEVWLINLGDALNGWNSQTTRKGHEVPSMSNKDQFDIFLECMVNYYETIFNSHLSNKYKVINILNDNHIGTSLNYIVMKAIELYLSQKYPEVEFIQQWEFIKTYKYGKHTIALTHGKDEKVMKFPMKMILDEKLDNWLNQYFLHQGSSPIDSFNHLIKGDLHSKNECFGKFGRYVNVASVMGTSDYIALNYGFSKSGALIEEYQADSNSVNSKTVWFQ